MFFSYPGIPLLGMETELNAVSVYTLTYPARLAEGELRPGLLREHRVYPEVLPCSHSPVWGQVGKWGSGPYC